MRTLKTITQAAALLVLGAACQIASASCYLVYAPDNSIVYRSEQTPVDLSLQLHTALAAVAPGGRLVFTPDDYNCQFETNQLDTLYKVAPEASTVRKRSTQKRRKARRVKAV